MYLPSCPNGATTLNYEIMATLTGDPGGQGVEVTALTQMHTLALERNCLTLARNYPGAVFQVNAASPHVSGVVVYGCNYFLWQLEPSFLGYMYIPCVQGMRRIHLTKEEAGLIFIKEMVGMST